MKFAGEGMIVAEWSSHHNRRHRRNLKKMVVEEGTVVGDGHIGAWHSRDFVVEEETS